MKTAKEMFIKLGYKLIKDKQVLIYDSDRLMICFTIITKTYSIDVASFEVDDFEVSIYEHQAITKQMQELGWIE